MKKLISSLLALMLILSLSGCGDSKPSEDDIVKSANMAFQAMDDKIERYSHGFKVTDYLKVDDAKIVNSYKQGNLYVVKAIPHIKITKDFKRDILKNFKIYPNSTMDGYIMDTMAFIYGLKQFDDGKIKKSSIAHQKWDFILEDGDEFNGLESTYKFRKTDNGWIPID